MSATNHVYASNIILVGKKFWDKLSPTEQKILQDSAIEARDYQRIVSREIAGKALAELKAKGMQINELSSEATAHIVKPIQDKFSAEYDPALVKTFRAELDRIGSL